MPSSDPPESSRFAHPVAVLLFNRPEYAELTLRSLAEQGRPAHPDLLLFSVDGYAGSRDEHLGRPDRTAEVAALVREMFPEAECVVHPANLGIARHFESVEQALFERAQAPWGVFLEDDFVLDARYLEVLSDLIEYAGSDERVAVLSASGNTRAAPSDAVGGLTVMDHAWAFALRASHYRERRAMLAPYLELVAEDSYFKRDPHAIRGAYVRRGIVPLGSSQDAIKQAVRRELGRVAITTTGSFGHYVGREGEHYSPEIFRALGYETPPPVPDAVPTLSMSLDALVPPLLALDRLLWAEQLAAAWESLERDVVEARSAAADASADAERHAAAERKLKEELAELTSSTSWRITRPVRSLADGFRRGGTR